MKCYYVKNIFINAMKEGKYMYKHPIIDIIKNYKSGKHDGIFSVCCSNKFVIEAAMDKIKNTDMYLLVEQLLIRLINLVDIPV